jgi:hypothetical protein
MSWVCWWGWLAARQGAEGRDIFMSREAEYLLEAEATDETISLILISSALTYITILSLVL